MWSCSKHLIAANLIAVSDCKWKKKIKRKNSLIFIRWMHECRLSYVATQDFLGFVWCAYMCDGGWGGRPIFKLNIRRLNRSGVESYPSTCLNITEHMFKYSADNISSYHRYDKDNANRYTSSYLLISDSKIIIFKANNYQGLVLIIFYQNKQQSRATKTINKYIINVTTGQYINWTIYISLVTTSRHFELSTYIGDGFSFHKETIHATLGHIYHGGIGILSLYY